MTGHHTTPPGLQYDIATLAGSDVAERARVIHCARDPMLSIAKVEKQRRKSRKPGQKHNAARLTGKHN